MADTQNPKLQTEIDIKSIHLFQPRVSIDLTAEELRAAERVPFPFFRRLSHRKESTWFISLIVILHLIAYSATMLVNDCWANSHGRCVFSQLGRLSFQPLSENPFLGPSNSALDNMGSLRLRYLEHGRLQLWRLLASPFLHAGVIHLVLSLSCVILVGIQLEEEFGPMRIGAIYIVSALTGSLFAALFLQDRPAVVSSGALFGLLGAAVSGLIQNRKVYTRKLATLIAFLVICLVHVGIGLMPLVNNFSNIGGLLCGILVSYTLLLKPKINKVNQNKAGIFEYNVKKNNTRKMELKFDLDKPILRSVSLVILILVLTGATLAILHGVDLHKYCSWCKYIDCIPSKWWNCSDKTMACEAMMSNTSNELTLTCLESGRFTLVPHGDNVSHARIEDICNVICS